MSPQNGRLSNAAHRRVRGGAQALFVIGVLAIVALMASSCGSDSDVSRAPDQPIIPGQVLYAENCASCHGQDLRGSNGGPSLLSIFYEPNHHTDASFRRAIETGSVQHHWTFGDMAPVEGLTEDDADAIIAYVRDVQESEGFES
jgi:mono/diheme cytochrome c family protein